MRETKYRGQRVDAKEWVYGYLTKDSTGKNYIITYFGCNITACSDCGMPSLDYFEVIPETIGQYTGQKDKNGTEIYEGDIVKCDGFIGAVEFKEDIAAYGIADIEKSKIILFLDIFIGKGTVEILGNIYQNLELLEV